MDELHKLLSDAGLTNLIGGRVAPSKIIGALMAKNKETGYSRPGVKPFDAKKLNNPSPFIQRKYLDGDVKPFDYCKAQQRRQTEEPEPEWKQYEYWGLTKDDLKGLTWPPFEWESPWNDKTYVGLAKHEPGKKRLTMMYFKDFPDKKGLPDNVTFSETQARKRGLTNVSQYNKEKKLNELDKEDEITTNDGIVLKGTNRILIRNYTKKRKDAGKKKRKTTFNETRKRIIEPEEPELIPPPIIKEDAPSIKEEKTTTEKKGLPGFSTYSIKEVSEAQRALQKAKTIPLRELFKGIQTGRRQPDLLVRNMYSKKALEVVKQRFNSITEDDVMDFDNLKDDGYARNILRIKKKIVNEFVDDAIELNKDNKIFNL